MASTSTLSQLRQESRTPFQLRSQCLDRAQSRRTNVVLHSLDVVVDDLLVEPEQREEIGEELVPAGDVASEGFAGGRQDEPAVLLVFEEPILVTLAWEIFRLVAISTTRAYPFESISSRMRSR
jgi:hypothetical protein